MANKLYSGKINLQVIVQYLKKLEKKEKNINVWSILLFVSTYKSVSSLYLDVREDVALPVRPRHHQLRLPPVLRTQQGKHTNILNTVCIFEIIEEG